MISCRRVVPAASRGGEVSIACWRRRLVLSRHEESPVAWPGWHVGTCAGRWQCNSAWSAIYVVIYECILYSVFTLQLNK
jgi:hypothetical protein